MNPKRIKKLRKENKYTQEQLAQYLQVDQTLISKFENGSRAINPTIKEKLCHLYGCTEAYFMGESNEYIPLRITFETREMKREDMESIAFFNKILMNLLYTSKIEGDESNEE